MCKLVRIKDSTYNELAKCGKWSDTMDSIIQRLLHQQQNNHEIDDTPKKSEREERPLLQESNGDGSSIQNCDSTSRANIIPDAIAEFKTRLDAGAAGEKAVEEERQRKEMMILEGDEGKNMPVKRPWCPASAPRRRELCANQNDNPHNKVGGGC